MVAAKKFGSIVGSVAKVNSEKLSAKPVANAMDASESQVSVQFILVLVNRVLAQVHILEV